ncbi:substrate-binding domain-containing protein [Pirellulaceae bacterium SH467]|jgi:LacI family transcriptional regulator
MTKQRKTVALLIETSNAYARGILEGIVEYQRTRDQWSVYLPELERGASPPDWLSDWKGDGVIARIETEAIASAVSQLQVPTIDVSAARRVPNIPWVETDDVRVADLAFEHLRERGFRHFAFCGPRGFNWALWRGEQFERRCLDAGLDISVHWTEFRSQSQFAKSVSRKSPESPMDHWLDSLPKPVGLFCAFDIQAQIVLDHCRNLGIQVPEQIAVVGVDNDPIVCNLAHPSISSVIPDARGAGQRAAELLDAWMQRCPRRTTKGPPKSLPESILLKPLGIESRQSTDVTAVSNPDIAAAVRFIRDHACDGIDVSHVLQHTPLSRRKLEYQFVEATGTTPHEMIARVRMERVRRLLQETDLPMEEIANRCGFEHPEYMNVVFKRRYQITPGRFRKQQMA